MDSIIDQIAADIANTLHWEFTLDLNPLVQLDMLRWRWISHASFYGPFSMEPGAENDTVWEVI